MRVEIKVPNIGESINEVTLSSWFKEDGEYVQIDEAICEFESDKATLELPAEVAGIITRVAAEGADLAIGALVAYIETDGTPSDKKEEKTVVAAKPSAPAAKEIPAPAPEKVVEKPKSTYADSHASPAAQKILDEKEVDAKAIEGTGKDGRITKEDALKASAGLKEWKEEEKKREEKPVTVAKSNPVAYQKPNRNFTREEHVEKMSRLRRTISKRLVAAKNETAMLTTFNDVDMSRVLEIREQYKDSFKAAHEIGLGFMSFFSKAAALALKNYPAVNAYVEEDNIIYHDFVDISIAVSTPKGLVVPVIRNVESLSFAEIEQEVKRLAIAGRDGQLSLEEMQGGTFTISNGGVFGSLLSTPIINQPQSAILGLHRIEDRPVAIKGKVEIRPMMYMALSYDHRIVDGKESVSLLASIKDYIENPEKMLYGDDPIKVLLEI
jgi:2-oxoglutarate dehydrogenase E2 component (dihydrolipoamide succinyltransferase)